MRAQSTFDGRAGIERGETPKNLNRHPGTIRVDLARGKLDMRRVGVEAVAVTEGADRHLVHADAIARVADVEILRSGVDHADSFGSCIGSAWGRLRGKRGQLGHVRRYWKANR